jgi:hypothetical protein
MPQGMGVQVPPRALSFLLMLVILLDFDFEQEQEPRSASLPTRSR